MKRLLILILLLISASGFSQTEREIEMIDKINELRTNPSSYIIYLIDLKSKYNDDKKSTDLIKLNQDTASPFYQKISQNYINELIKIEKIKEDYLSNIDETINFLDTVTPVGQLKFNLDIYESLEVYDFSKCEIVNKEEKTLTLQHTKIPNESYGENIFAGDRNILNVILYLLIDYNVESKGHRKNLFDPNWSQIAVYEVKYLENITFVQNFTR